MTNRPLCAGAWPLRPKQASLLADTNKLLDFSLDGEWTVVKPSQATAKNHVTGLRLPAVSGKDAFASWWGSFLQGNVPSRIHQNPSRVLRYADLFCSIGGLSLGFSMAAEVLGYRPVSELAADVDPDVLSVYRRNVRPTAVAHTGVQRLVDFDVRVTEHGASFVDDPCLLPRKEVEHLKEVDVLLAGPPCQGHSSLNNHTRSDDPRNGLYLTVPAIAVAANIPLVIIENVPNVVNDRMGVVDATKDLLRAAGYHIQFGVINIAKLGWPQTRKRFFLVASRNPFPTPMSDFLDANTRETLPLSWAIEDLLERQDAASSAEWDRPSRLSAANQERVEWLVADKSRRNLNHDMRPVSHQRNPNYPAVYGKLDWDGPAGTITGGFLSPGRGRFTHPIQARGLTPHEGARIQGFPDSYDFMTDAKFATRTSVARWIGNAVPPAMGFFAASYALSSFGAAQG